MEEAASKIDFDIFHLNKVEILVGRVMQGLTGLFV